jgi:myo-inositol catabolism protein IolS
VRYLRCGFEGADFQMPCLGIGTIGAGSGETATENSIKERLDSFALALDLGANFFDVGEDYEDGFAEKILGRFAKGQRHKLLIATKFTPKHAAYEDLLRAAEGSLRRLQTEYIDIYQMHWPNSTIPLDETIAAMERLMREGKVLSIGLSNCSIQFAKSVNALLVGARVATNQVKFNAFNRPTAAEPNYFTESVHERLTSLAYGIFGQGKMQFGDEARSLIRSLCQKYLVSEAQLLIAWILTFPRTVALIRSMNQEHIRKNIAATDLVLDAADADSLTSCFRIVVREIPVARIMVSNSDPDVSHKIYMSLKEALLNEHELYPDVKTIASEIEAGDSFRPVELIPDGQNYQLVQGRMRYWAWRYLHGVDSMIPAVIIANT